MPVDIRPTQHMVRKALFDLLGQDMVNVEFLELFSGSGAVGLEAISREAKKVIFVEKELRCIKVIEENIQLLDIEPDENKYWPYEVIKGDGFATIKKLFREKRTFDLIFADPPYGRGMAKKALKTLEAYDILRPNCILAIQHEVKETLPETHGRFFLFKQRKYGTSLISLYSEKKEN
ncbi:16S rRNA (guanine(966)-N(2))-methyltransferase [hydrothermal vent metagenome]|uniref:16S rRNA (Guanine(966)-N(2))-methyltransferase n=2 Tax=hydrothermal vent metagenome TaxID=652676 RepID=A0A3B1D516_9ZZZZ